MDLPGPFRRIGNSKPSAKKQEMGIPMREKPGIDSIFCSAIDIESPEERDLYVERVCGDDTELKRQVERLLHAHVHGGDRENPY